MSFRRESNATEAWVQGLFVIFSPFAGHNAIPAAYTSRSSKESASHIEVNNTDQEQGRRRYGTLITFPTDYTALDIGTGLEPASLQYNPEALPLELSYTSGGGATPLIHQRAYTRLLWKLPRDKYLPEL